jgi:hypothetical protein
VAARRVGSVTKVPQSCALAEGRSTDAVVGDGELECACCSTQGDLDVTGVAVLDGVSGCLGGDVVSRGLDPALEFAGQIASFGSVLPNRDNDGTRLTGGGAPIVDESFLPHLASANDFRQYVFLDMRRGNWQSRSVRRKI